MKFAALLAALHILGTTGVEAQSKMRRAVAGDRETPTLRIPAVRPPRDTTISPLDRRVTVHLRDVALRDALDRVAILADIRLSYSGDNLPLDRRVSIWRDSALVSDVFVELLAPHGVEARAVSTDHVVLVPRVAIAVDSLPRSIAVLDRVVVTGNVLAGPERELPIALDVVSGREIERRDESAMSEILSGTVPGIWLWEQTPTSILARYASIRGASSFGLSFPKVYIDGIEVANPLLLTQITPEIVERIEVIRGPQGAALYGSDAISGVVNIVSRHEGTSPDGEWAVARSAIGFAQSAFTQGSVPVQDHSLTVHLGDNLRSAGITIGGSTSGQYIPQAQSRELRAVADGRLIGERSTLTASARGYTKNAGVPTNPLLAALNPDEIQTDSDPQQLRMYALGSTLTLAPNDAWLYSFTAGVDGYSLRNVSIEQSAIPSVADSVLRNASGSAMRGTMRASVVTKFGSPERIASTLTFALEESALFDRTERDLPSGSGSQDNRLTNWSSNTGLSAQSNVTVFDALFLSAGVRRERLGQTTGESRFATLPMVGAALARGNPTLTWKLRGAFGKGVRAAHSTMHLATREPRRTLPNPDLEPESQSGVEAGGDLVLWHRLGLHVTRFDQLASGLIQTVGIVDPSNSGPGSRRTWYQLQNVGEISNRGWETQATLSFGAVSLAGAASFVDSRVQKVAAGYTGDLRPGDRMLAVPARTISGTAGWTTRRLSASASLSRASDWINYDRLAIATALIAADGDADNLTGSNLRQYWVSYPGATRLRGSVSFDVRRGILLVITGENLLNYQRGEPDTITIVPGRTITAGLKARF
jgi:iron complex outermembrane recepter protein